MHRTCLWLDTVTERRLDSCRPKVHQRLIVGRALTERGAILVLAAIVVCSAHEIQTAVRDCGKERGTFLMNWDARIDLFGIRG